MLHINKLLTSIIFVSALAFISAGCTSESDIGAPTTYPNADILLSAEEFAVAINDERTIVIDTRTSDSLFQVSHIPGAVHFHSRRDLNDPDSPIEFFMVGPEVFEAQMRGLGVHNDSRILIYDEGNSLGAARLFYALEYFGHEGHVALLNGGYLAWLDAEMEVTGHEVMPMPEGKYTSRVQADRVCDVRQVMEAVNNPNMIVFDVRSPEEFDGTDVRAERGGHIPGAIHLEWSEVLIDDGDVPFFKPFVEIEALYADLGITRDKEVIPHCHTNVRGSHAYFTLRLMGYDSVRPYEGSWSEYGNM